MQSESSFTENSVGNTCMNLQQELSFKSKPNVWAYFSVKVIISIETLLYKCFTMF